MHDPCQSGKCLIFQEMLLRCPVSGVSVNTQSGQFTRTIWWPDKAGHPAFYFGGFCFWA